MWAWGFLTQRLLPSVVVMLTTYALVLGVIFVFRVKSRNVRIALLILPLFKSLLALVVGVPSVRLAHPVPVFFGLKLPDVDQLSSALSLRSNTPDFFFPGPSASSSTSGLSANWGSIFNWVFALLAVASTAIIAWRLARFVGFYRRVVQGPDVADDVLLRGTAERAAETMEIPLPKVVAVDVDHSFVPFTIGWRRPAVVLPRKLLDSELLSDSHLESVLAHEFAHIKRRDYLLNWVFSVAHSLLFFNPLTKRVILRAYEAAEEACDALAVRTTSKPKALVDALMRIARETREGTSGVRKLDPRSIPETVGSYTNSLMSGQRLKERILRIESGEALRHPPRWLRVIKTIPAILFVAVIAVVQINVALPIGGSFLFLQ